MTKRLPTLKQMQYLIALHQHQHFGRAAKACFIEQSTLSAAVVELEETLGASLIERAHKTFRFTPLGEVIVEHSMTLLSQVHGMFDDVRSYSGWTKGTLHIGCIPTIAPFIISEVMSAAAISYPELLLVWHEDTSAHLLALLQEGKIDLVVMALPFPLEGFQQIILKADPFRLVMSQRSNVAQYQQTLVDWPKYSLMLLTDIHCLSQQISQACQLHQTNVISPIRTVSLYTLLQLVKNQQGVTILPQLAIDSGFLDGTGLVVKELSCLSGASRDIALVYRKSSLNKTMYEEFAVFLKKIL